MIKRLALAAPTALIIVALASTTATAQIPSFAEVTGHEFGERPATGDVTLGDDHRRTRPGAGARDRRRRH